MPPIRIRPRASSDLIEIWSYIAEDSAAHADAFIDKIHATLQVLALQPESGRRREELAPGIRSFPCGRYIVFYLPVASVIEVVRVLHSARDIENVFEGQD
jgi:toxin ParE1/3/4